MANDDINLNDFNYEPQFGGGGDDVFMNKEYLKDWDKSEQEVRIRLVSPTYTRLVVSDADSGQLIQTKDWDISDFKMAMENSQTYKFSQQFLWVVLLRPDNEEESPKAKIYEAGTGVFKKIQSIANDPDWQPIHEVDLKIKRKGHKKDARYDVMPSPKNRGALSDNEFAIADEVQLTKYSPQSMPIAKFKETFGG